MGGSDADGAGDILELVRGARAATRAELRDATGLSRMTVAQRVDALLEAGLLVEGPTRAATGGRRPRALRFHAEQAHVLVATVNTTHLRTALTDLDGRLLGDHHVDIDLTTGPERTLHGIEESARRLLANSVKERADEPVEEPAAGFAGIGISVPGPVDPRSGRLSQPPLMPGWDAYPISERLQDGFPGVPVLTANDADAAAAGEQARGFPRERALCLVKVDTGIGCGLVIDGHMYQGGTAAPATSGTSGSPTGPTRCAGAGAAAASRRSPAAVRSPGS